MECATRTSTRTTGWPRRPCLFISCAALLLLVLPAHAHVDSQDDANNHTLVSDDGKVHATKILKKRNLGAGGGHHHHQPYGDHQTHHGSHSGSDHGSDQQGDRLDRRVRYLINDIQNRIEIAKTAIEDKIAITNLKKTTQGWAIIVGSWKDVLSNWMDRDSAEDQASEPGFDANETLSLYGYLFSYGIGFGGPLLLGQDSDDLDCDSNTFVKLLRKYELSDGIKSHNYSHGDGGDFELEEEETRIPDLMSRVNEFDLISHAQLNCILEKTEEHKEAAEVEYALDELVAALRARLLTRIEDLVLRIASAVDSEVAIEKARIFRFTSVL